jgi:hypothetical protein
MINILAVHVPFSSAMNKTRLNLNDFHHLADVSELFNHDAGFLETVPDIGGVGLEKVLSKFSGSPGAKELDGLITALVPSGEEQIGKAADMIKMEMGYKDITHACDGNSRLHKADGYASSGIKYKMILAQREQDTRSHAAGVGSWAACPQKNNPHVHTRQRRTDSRWWKPADSTLN